VDGKRMHAVGKLGGKCGINQAMALEPALPGEGLRHDIHPEMRFPAGTMAGVALVAVGLVDDPQALRPESFGQLPCDEVVSPHWPALERDDFSSNRHPALTPFWSMMFSENLYPLFGIML
jgi:hypothetical protein